MQQMIPLIAAVFPDIVPDFRNFIIIIIGKAIIQSKTSKQPKPRFFVVFVTLFPIVVCLSCFFVHADYNTKAEIVSIRFF